MDAFSEAAPAEITSLRPPDAHKQAFVPLSLRLSESIENTDSYSTTSSNCCTRIIGIITRLTAPSNTILLDIRSRWHPQVNGPFQFPSNRATNVLDSQSATFLCQGGSNNYQNLHIDPHHKDFSSPLMRTSKISPSIELGLPHYTISQPRKPTLYTNRIVTTL